jgi:hypothetical protein
MTRVRGVSGGGASGNFIAETKNPKREPINNSVSMNRPSMIGLAHWVNQDKGPLYQHGGVDSTPKGPNHNLAVGPGAGRQVLRAGSQARTPSVSSPPKSPKHW